MMMIMKIRLYGRGKSIRVPAPFSLGEFYDSIAASTDTLGIKSIRERENVCFLLVRKGGARRLASGREKRSET